MAIDEQQGPGATDAETLRLALLRFADSPRGCPYGSEGAGKVFHKLRMVKQP